MKKFIKSSNQNSVVDQLGNIDESLISDILQNQNYMFLIDEGYSDDLQAFIDAALRIQDILSHTI